MKKEKRPIKIGDKITFYNDGLLYKNVAVIDVYITSNIFKVRLLVDLIYVHRRQIMKVLRKKPKAPKKREPRTIWVNEYPDSLSSFISKTIEDADEDASSDRIRCVKLVEVLE